MRHNRIFHSLVIAALFVFFTRPASADELTFGWVLPAAAAVTQTKIDRGVKTVSSFTLTASASSDTKVLVEISDVKLISINEQPADEIQLNPQTRALMSAVPSYVVSKETGQVESLVGFDEMIQSVVSLLDDSEAKPQMEAFFRNPQISNMLYAKSADLWNVMVGAWVGQAVTLGKEAKFTYTIPMGELEIPTTATYNFERVTEAPEALRLYLKSVQELPPVILFNMAAAMLSNLPDGEAKIEQMKADLNAGKVSGNKVVTINTIHIEQYLLPIQIVKEEETVVREEGKEPQRQKSMLALQFDWRN